MLVSKKGYPFLKRGMDIVGALAALIILSPVMVYVACRVKKNLGSPVLFYQIRPGLHERAFKIYKFRSMAEVFDSDGTPLPDIERLTSFGAFLRSSSLDELPELWNVLKGDMSLVGPRPLLVEFLPLYSEEEARRHFVRPSITGLAQINGRNSITWDKRLEYDCYYVENMSLLLDLKIMWKTISIVIRKDGTSAGEKETIITPPKTIKRPNILKELGYVK